MKKSWIVPNLGGWLSIANLVSFLTLIGLEMTFDVPEPLFVVLLLGLTAPIAFYWMLPAGHGPTYLDVVVVPIVIVINAFVWGYGLAAIIRWMSRPVRLESDELREGQQ